MAKLSDQEVRLYMLSTVSVTSGRIFSAVEAKLTSLIGMKIFNNGIQFIIGEEETFRAMVSASTAEKILPEVTDTVDNIYNRTS